ncbi:MAG: hypothetical protein NWE95_12350 [Candidatus Bathyarchaeota archaeon]|nr:hypothetical protein [Candidatus Bathyarchaeota archaeon]
MEATVATLLLVTSAVIIACVVVTYAVVIVEQTMNNQNVPELARLKELQNRLLNETYGLYNQTEPQLPDSPPLP